MKLATATASLLLLQLSATASEITSTGSASQTVTQQGRVDCSAGFFSGVSCAWNYVYPNLGYSSNWVDVPVTVSGPSIPAGSTIQSATLSWTRSGPSTSQESDLISFNGVLGGSIAPNPWTQNIINWVEGPSLQWLLPLPPPSGPSGSIDLITLFGSNVDSYILGGGDFVLGANTQISLSNGSISRSGAWFDSDSVFDVNAQSAVTVQATLDIMYTPPAILPPPSPGPDPSPSPEPLTSMMCGLGLISIGWFRWKRR